MKSGEWYYCVLEFGWVLVGRFDGEREGVFGYWLENARFVRLAKTDHGTASKTGFPPDAETKDIGRDGRALITPLKGIWITETVKPGWAND